jgi:hypothetical protein
MSALDITAIILCHEHFSALSHLYSISINPQEGGRVRDNGAQSYDIIHLSFCRGDTRSSAAFAHLATEGFASTYQVVGLHTRKGVPSVKPHLATSQLVLPHMVYSEMKNARTWSI